MTDPAPPSAAPDLRSGAGVAIRACTAPARHRRAVFFCVDRGFFPYALFVADQIARKCPARGFDLCILTDHDPGTHPIWADGRIRILTVDFAALADLLATDARISLVAYLRIFAPAMLADDYDRLLYLDADVFYQRGDLDRLLGLDLGGRALGAVRDMIQLRKPDRRPADTAPFVEGHHRYFNSGVLLIDVAGFMAADVARRAIAFATEHAETLQELQRARRFFHDQTILNILFRDAWAELSLVWNYEYSHQTMYFAAMFDVCIYHFIGRRKPFKGSYGGYPRRFTQEYRRFFAEDYPDAAVLAGVQDGLRIAEHRFAHLRVLLWHAINAHRFLPNEGRFADDFEVRG
jgi:hypothetical protein